MGRTAVGTQLTIAEELIVAAIENNSYFVWNETPTGTINGSNTVFTLANTPNPLTSLKVFVNGMLMKAEGEDYTLVGGIITFVTAPPTNSILTVGYTVDPN